MGEWFMLRTVGLVRCFVSFVLRFLDVFRDTRGRGLRRVAGDTTSPVCAMGECVGCGSGPVCALDVVGCSALDAVGCSTLDAVPAVGCSTLDAVRWMRFRPCLCYGRWFTHVSGPASACGSPMPISASAYASIAHANAYSTMDRLPFDPSSTPMDRLSFDKCQMDRLSFDKCQMTLVI